LKVLARVRDHGLPVARYDVPKCLRLLCSWPTPATCTREF
jgi:hypothetical protein